MKFSNKIQSHHLFYLLFLLWFSIFHSNSSLKKYVIEWEFKLKRAQLCTKKKVLVSN
jgi:hypothetical protein